MNNEKILAHVRMLVLREKLLCPGEPLHLAAAVSGVTASLMASMNVPILLMGVILPVYAVIDMIETMLNVWSDSTVAAMVNKDLYGDEDEAKSEAVSA